MYFETLQFELLRGTLNAVVNTSDSLNEGLPLKMVIKVSKKMIFFFHEKDSNFNYRIIHTSVFRIGPVPI